MSSIDFDEADACKTCELVESDNSASNTAAPSFEGA